MLKGRREREREREIIGQPISSGLTPVHTKPHRRCIKNPRAEVFLLPILAFLTSAFFWPLSDLNTSSIMLPVLT
jgi:hypothetical protein